MSEKPEVVFSYLGGFVGYAYDCPTEAEAREIARKLQDAGADRADASPMLDNSGWQVSVPRNQSGSITAAGFSIVAPTPDISSTFDAGDGGKSTKQHGPS